MSLKVVGILGGGQLGCMLADAAISLGLNVRIFAEASSPAAVLHPGKTTFGSVNDEAALRAFFSQLHLVAIENEFLDTELLNRAAKGLEITFGPSLSCIREIQDKLRQKQILAELGLPTSPFFVITPGMDPKEAVQEAFNRFPQGPVFKWSRMGYDGKGVCLARPDHAGQEQAVRFCADSLNRGVPVYAEAKIAFRRELAIVASRSSQGAFKAFPLVVSEQKNGICHRVFGPATQLGVSPELEAQAQEHARRLGESMGLVGSYALELFETQDGQISINEIAPRVHNTGHYSQDACPASQFENHWRALLDLPLGDTHPARAFAMLNLLGPDGVQLKMDSSKHTLPFSEPQSGLHLHWYYKHEVRPGRKVGHVNGTTYSFTTLEALTHALELYQQRWTAELNALSSSREN